MSFEDERRVERTYREDEQNRTTPSSRDGAENGHRITEDDRRRAAKEALIEREEELADDGGGGL